MLEFLNALCQVMLTLMKTLQTIIVNAFKLLEPPPETRSLQLANIEVLINAILYNAAAALHIMESQDPTKLKLFFTQWFNLVKEDMDLPRVHDKKLSILAFCALLKLERERVPGELLDGWVGIVGGILQLLEEYPKAVESEFQVCVVVVEADFV